MTHKILAIDDHPETLSIIVATLQGHGYNVLASRSPFRGVELAREEVPDLILVDMQMPDMDGLEVTREVRKMAVHQKTPIMMFTAVGDAEHKKAGFQAGVDDYITKPTEPMELVERVESLLETIPDPDPDDNQEQGYSGQETLITDRNDFGFTSLSPSAEQTPIIAVIGARGGAGTTSVAINLAYSIADIGNETTLIDYDWQQGHISLYLNQKSTDGLNELLDMGLTYENIQRVSTSFGRKLHVLLTRPNLYGRYPFPAPEQTSQLLDVLLEANQTVVADLGLGTLGTTKPILDRADQIILCLSPERVSLASARRQLEGLQSSLFPHTTLNVVICELSGSGHVPETAVSKYLGHPVLTSVSISRKELALSVNKGIPVVQAFPQTETTSQFRSLAQQLVKA